MCSQKTKVTKKTGSKDFYFDPATGTKIRDKIGQRHGYEKLAIQAVMNI